MMRGIGIVHIIWTITTVCCQEDGAFWRKMAAADLERLLDSKTNENVARNVILFVGDGMGVSTVTAARILKGQTNNISGEQAQLAFEDFPYVGLSKTYSVNFQTPDSASTATAFLGGVKTNSGVLGYDSTVKFARCSSATPPAKVQSILQWAQADGKSTGIVTTTRVTHATPAAAYAHSVSRNWEGDVRVSSSGKAQGCKDIAYQLVLNNTDIQVILGGGRRFFLPANAIDPDTNSPNLRYGRLDGLNLIETWKGEKALRQKNHSYVWNKAEFDKVDPRYTDYLLGLFSSSHMSYEMSRPASQPSIADMTRKSIEILQKNRKGYFLLVEGGRIDHGHHANMANRALTDTLAFDKAIEVAKGMTNESDTLIVVTADHSHVMVISGYASRNNPILGVMDKTVMAPTLDKLPFTTLLYGNGPGFSMVNGTRRDITGLDTDGASFRQHAGVPLKSETHAGEDVAVYARGPMSHLFSGVREQSFLAAAMGYAACIGQDKRHCLSKTTKPLTPSREGPTTTTTTSTTTTTTTRPHRDTRKNTPRTPPSRTIKTTTSRRTTTPYVIITKDTGLEKSKTLLRIETEPVHLASTVGSTRPSVALAIFSFLFVTRSFTIL